MATAYIHGNVKMKWYSDKLYDYHRSGHDISCNLEAIGWSENRLNNPFSRDCTERCFFLNSRNRMVLRRCVKVKSVTVNIRWCENNSDSVALLRWFRLDSTTKLFLYIDLLFYILQSASTGSLTAIIKTEHGRLAQVSITYS